jgi:hypothetical protein
MTQHDLDIANASGAVVRADINNALVALGTTMKGPNAPPAPAAGMIWLDDNTPSTTIWTLKIYDGTDWITIGLLDTSANIYTASGSTIGTALIWAADQPTARNAIGAMPIAQAGSGVGQFSGISAGVGISAVLPAGGNWIWSMIAYTATGVLATTASGLSGGGATIGSNPSHGYFGWAWRIN